MALPSGYKRLVYIQSSGTQYINTNYYANQNTEVICEAELLSGSLPVLFGHYQSASNQFAAFFYGSKAAWSYWCGTASGQISGTYTGKRRIVLNSTSLTVDGQTTTFTTSNFTATIPMFIFGLHQDNTMMYGESMRLYSLQVKSSGSLVRDYIPCKNASNVIGLWDDVNSVFYANAGSGTFTAGPEITILPTGYKRLEYIQSSGTQYIDTGYYPKWNTRVVDDIKMSAYSATRAAFGVRNSNSATASAAYTVFQTGANTFRSDYFGTSQTITLDVTTNQRVTIDKNKNVCTIGGKTVTNTAKTSGTSSYSLLLFTYSNSGSAGSMSSMTRYSTEIYEGDVLTRYYIPCETNSGEIGLWDCVNGVFYGNAGTGSFIAGPEYGTPPPAGDHNTNIGEISYAIEGGTVLVGGVEYELGNGLTLVNGVEREIELKEPEIYQVTVGANIAGSGSQSYHTLNKVYINGKQILGSSNPTPKEVEEGTIIRCTAASQRAGYTGTVYYDDVLVAEGEPAIYEFPLTSNIGINGAFYVAGSADYWRGSIKIRTV